MNKIRSLFVGQLPPFPTASGGNQRTHLILRALKNLGPVDIVLSSSYLTYDYQDLEKIRSEFGRVTVAPHNNIATRVPLGLLSKLAGETGRGVASIISNRQQQYAVNPSVASIVQQCIQSFQPDVVVGRMMMPACWSGLLELSIATIVDIDDLDTQALESRINTARSFVHRLALRRQANQLQTIFPALLRRLGRGWVTNREDYQNLLSLGAPANILPNIPFPKFGYTTAYNKNNFQKLNKSKVVMMVGDMVHKPNRLGLIHFLDRIWPSVVAELPDARFRVIGSNMWNVEDVGSRPGVEYVGFVESLDDEYQRSAFSVVPVFEGGGTKIKVLETFSYGRTAVVSRHAMRGYSEHLHHGVHLKIAQTDIEFSRHIVELLRNPLQQVEMAAAGRCAVEHHFSWDRFKSIIESDILQIVERSNQSGKKYS